MFVKNNMALNNAAKYGSYVALAIIFLWFGGMKFTSYEAEGIKGLVENSPFLSWLYHITGVQGVSAIIGVIEIVIGLLLLGRFISPKLSAIGALGGVITFLLTCAMFFSTPGVFIDEVGPLAIAVIPGQFILKDLGLLFLSFLLFVDSNNSMDKRQSLSKAPTP